MVIIDSDLSEQRLVGFNRSNAVITAINPASVNLRIWKHSLENFAPQDVKPETDFDTVSISFNQQLMARLMNEGRGQRAEGRRQKTEDRRQKTDK